MRIENPQPLVSILMTAYNQEKYIGDAIKSVLALSYHNWELIITDDCSTDLTIAICEKFVTKDERIKLFKNDRNLGDYNNRNKAASLASGKYMKYLDADDLIYPYGLCAMVDAMERYTTAGFGLSYWKIDDNLPYPQLVESKDVIKQEYLGKSLLAAGPSASIILREAFIKVGGFSGKQFIGDTELWLKLAMKYDLVKLAPALNWYRRHEAQQIHLENNDISTIITRFKLKLHFLDLNSNQFTAGEHEFALEKIYRNHARIILRDYFFKFRFKHFNYLVKNSNISVNNLLSGFKPYLHSYNE